MQPAHASMMGGGALPGDSSGNGTSSPTNTGTTNASAGMSIYTATDLRQTDVLLGRGPIIQRYDGNVAFRAHVATRKTEYLEAKHNVSTKQVIAAQVVQHVRQGCSPPGRFLRRIEKTQVVALGYDEKTELWTEAEEATVMEKAKQMLRERPTGDGSGIIPKRNKNKRRTSSEKTESDTTAKPSEPTCTADVNTQIIQETNRHPTVPSPPVVVDPYPAPASFVNSQQHASIASGAAGAVQIMQRQVQQNTTPNVQQQLQMLVSAEQQKWRESNQHYASDNEDSVITAAGYSSDTGGIASASTSVLVEGDGPVNRHVHALGGNIGRLDIAAHQGSPMGSLDNAQDRITLEDIAEEDAIADRILAQAMAASESDSRPRQTAAADVSHRHLHDSVESLDINVDDIIAFEKAMEHGQQQSLPPLSEMPDAPAAERTVTDDGIFPEVAPVQADNHLQPPQDTGNLSVSTRARDIASHAASQQTPINEAKPISTSNDLLDKVRVALGTAQALQRRHSSNDANNDDNDNMVRRDLRTLGFILQQHIAGIDANVAARHVVTDKRKSSAGTDSGRSLRDDDGDDDDADGRPNQSKRRQSSDYQSTASTTCDSLAEAGLPSSLRILITSLIDAVEDAETAPDKYKSVKDVEEDLNLMLSDPARYLYDAPPERLTGRLSLPEGKLYGHDEHYRTLHSTFETSLGNAKKRSIAMVCGDSGTGKSSLVEMLRGPLTEQHGRMIWCKFDAMDQSQSMSLIFRAFNDYCRSLLSAEALPILIKVRKELRLALGNNVSALLDLLPDLKGVYGPIAESAGSSSADAVGGRNVLDRFLHYFRIFVRTVAKQSHPVILVVDDLQWADSKAIQLISTLVCDQATDALFCVGIYREGEVADDHPLTSELASIASAGVMEITKIRLGDLDGLSTNQLVSDALFLPPRLTRSLSSVIHARTGGNALFVIEFLSALVNDGLLQYSGNSRRWEWDLDEIKGQVIAGNTIALMTAKMEKLPHRLKWLLRVASCFGGEFRASTMKLLDSQMDTISTNDLLGPADAAANDENVVNQAHIDGVTLNAFELLVEKGFIIAAGSAYRFAHDSIQEAAYEMTAEAERSLFHLTVGRLLLDGLPSAANFIDDDIIYEVVGQLNRGLDLLEDDRERLQVAELNLMAGEKSASVGAFNEAALYVLNGTTIIADGDWVGHFSVCLRLFTLCSELMYVIADYDKAIVAARYVLEHAIEFDDKVLAYVALIQSLGGTNELKAAITCGLEFLELLGEPFPADITREDVAKEFNKTKDLLNGRLEALGGRDIADNTKALEDKHKITAMKVLIILFRMCLTVDAVRAGVIVSRLVQITLCDGICAESCFAFAAFTNPCCKFKEFALADTCARAAKALLNKSGDMYYSNVIHILYVSISTYKEPLQACSDQFLRGCEVGMGIGNIDYGLSCLSHHATLSILAPKRSGTLQEAVKVMEDDFVQLEQYNHRTATFILAYLQTGLNLLEGTANGKKDPSVMEGDAIESEQQYIEEMTKRNMFFAITSAHSCRVWLKYLFRRYEGADDLVLLLQSCIQTSPILCAAEKISIYLYLGVMATHLARTRKSLPDGDDAERFRSIADEALQEMKSMASIGCDWNYENKLHLMTAELAYCDGDLTTASKSYDLAITSAEAHGFIHEQALAAERAGLFYAETSEAAGWVLAVPYFEQALSIWDKWGARAKVEDLLQLLESDGEELRSMRQAR